MNPATATSLIADSIQHDHITHAPATLDLVADLTAACDDSVQNGDVLEMWGTNDDGEEWRIHLDGSVQPEAERVIRELAKQDKGGETGGRKPSTSETIKAWYEAAGQAGDLGVCRAVDALGYSRAAEVYDEVNPAE